MSQVNITVDYEEVVALFSKERNEAFAYLMEKILNAFLLAESEDQIGASKHERSEDRNDYRNGTRDRPLVTRIGKLTLKVPRHRNVPFVTMIFDQYQRNEAALLTTMMDMVVQGVSTRKVTNVVEELCGTSFSKSTVSELCRRLDESIKQFKNRPLKDPYPFVITDAKYFKVRENHSIVSKAFMVAMGITEDGRREIIDFGTYDNESERTWKEFLTSLKKRGVNPDMIASDAHQGLLAGLKEVYPEVPWQRCQYHFQENILKETPKKEQKGLKTELREMFNAKTMKEARERRNEIIQDYKDVAPKAMEILDEGFEEAMTVMLLPESMRIPLRTTNYLERENGELGRRSDVIRIFPNAASLTRLMGAVLIDRNDIMSTRNALFTKEKCINAIEEAKPKLIKIAQEQVKLLKAA
ncbi:MAG TPA: IS256 family transposase [Bacillota bacterium]|jgi:transposase-like protein|nr:IS256 family transposase [Bacillota bacterium]